MKKYKLIKKYPGSPRLGTEVTDIQEFFSKYQYHLYPEFWQEVIEKDYEILSFIDSFGCLLIYEENIKLFRRGNKWSENHLTKTLIGCLDRYKIYSIKRLSDGEIFTIGDDILEQNEHSKIEYFELKGNDLVLRINHQVTKGSSTILINSKFEKYIPKIPLFKTEDNIDIFENDIVYRVNRKNIELWANYNVVTNYDYNFMNKVVLHFSTKKAAEEYIIMNKPCLSINDVLEWAAISEINEMKKLVKSRL